MPGPTWITTSTVIGTTMMLAAALMLTVWVRGRQWRHRRTACIACGHSRHTLAADAPCVECGLDPRAARRHCRSRRRRWLLPGTLLFVVGAAVAGGEWALNRLPGWLPDRALVASEPVVWLLDIRSPPPLANRWTGEVRHRLADHCAERPFSRAAAATVAHRWLNHDDYPGSKPLDWLVYLPPLWPIDEPVRLIFGPPEPLDSVPVRTHSAVVLLTPDGTVLAYREVSPPIPRGMRPHFGPLAFAGRIVDLSVEVPASAITTRSVLLKVAIVELDGWERLDLPPPSDAVLASRTIERTLPHTIPLFELGEPLSDPAVDALLATAIRACLTVAARSDSSIGCVHILIDFDRVPGSMRLGLAASISWLGQEVSIGPLIPNRAPWDPLAAGTFAVDLSAWEGTPHMHLLGSQEPWPSDVPRPRLVVRGDPLLALRTADRIRETFTRVWTGSVDLPLLRCVDDWSVVDGWEGDCP